MFARCSSEIFETKYLKGKHVPHLQEPLRTFISVFGIFESQFEQVPFSEAMPHGKDQRPGLGRKTRTSS